MLTVDEEIHMKMKCTCKNNCRRLLVGGQYVDTILEHFREKEAHVHPSRLLAGDDSVILLVGWRPSLISWRPWLVD